MVITVTRVINNSNANTNVNCATIMTTDIMTFHPVHLMNANSAADPHSNLNNLQQQYGSLFLPSEFVIIIQPKS